MREWRERERVERGRRAGVWRERRAGGGHYDHWRDGVKEGARRRTSNGEGGGVVTSFFFSNIAASVGELELWKAFQRWGKVWEIFIPQKRDRFGRRFGFVRFLNISNPSEVVKQLDNMEVGGRRLHVNFPRFEKARRDHQVPSGEGLNSVKVDRGARKELQGSGFRSFKEALLQGNNRETNTNRVNQEKKHVRIQKKSGMDKVDLDLQLEGIPDNWLEKSFVGELRDITQAKSLQEELLLLGACTIQVRTMGDNLVLLTGREGRELDYLLTNENEWIKNNFTLFEPWSPLFVPKNRVVWVRCEGVPLNLWTRQCFDILVKSFGELVAVDESTASFTTLDVARVQVRTAKLEAIQISKRVKLNAVVYWVRMVEELASQDFRCRCSVRSSSEDSFSDWFEKEMELSSTGDRDIDDDGGWEKEPRPSGHGGGKEKTLEDALTCGVGDNTENATLSEGFEVQGETEEEYHEDGKHQVQRGSTREKVNSCLERNAVAGKIGRAHV